MHDLQADYRNIKNMQEARPFILMKTKVEENSKALKQDTAS
jgi:hypothetical protein